FSARHPGRSEAESRDPAPPLPARTPSLIKNETILYNILIFLLFPCYFSLLAQRKVTKRKGALRPASPCASQKRAGPSRTRHFLCCRREN
ncbi:MAG: hypothetical protein K9K88_19205, partial [Desulfobacterales bacterium]|nr:hypothetical protein [Desulfobacterales bacterium]